MSTARRMVREIGLALITLGVVLLLFIAYQLFGTGIAEAHSQSALSKQFAAQVATNRAHASVAPGDRTASDAPLPIPGGAVDRLVIPKIGLEKIVVQGVAEDDLRKGPGHYPSTVMPGGTRQCCYSRPPDHLRGSLFSPERARRRRPHIHHRYVRTDIRVQRVGRPFGGQSR